jgi:hypothetical protein
MTHFYSSLLCVAITLTAGLAGCSNEGGDGSSEFRFDGGDNTSVGTVRLTTAKARQITQGMSLEQAERIVGAKARKLTDALRRDLEKDGISAQSSTGGTTYVWRNGSDWLLVEIDDADKVSSIMVFID